MCDSALSVATTWAPSRARPTAKCPVPELHSRTRRPRHQPSGFVVSRYRNSTSDAVHSMPSHPPARSGSRSIQERIEPFTLKSAAHETAPEASSGRLAAVSPSAIMDCLSVDRTPRQEVTSVSQALIQSLHTHTNTPLHSEDFSERTPTPPDTHARSHSCAGVGRGKTQPAGRPQSRLACSDRDAVTTALRPGCGRHSRLCDHATTDLKPAGYPPHSHSATRRTQVSSYLRPGPPPLRDGERAARCCRPGVLCPVGGGSGAQCTASKNSKTARFWKAQRLRHGIQPSDQPT